MVVSSRDEKIRLSAVWAAYGDALGFVTELADADRVSYRSGSAEVERTKIWRRTLNSRTGTTVTFPAGTYSDDTQLRLATARAIRVDGTFDVAAFAKVELTAWSNYALGAGVGSLEAAANLARTSATWYSNFFSGRRAAYTQGGGNGAAMRVQPHVWAARTPEDLSSILPDVIRNSLCTHGHPRGIVGACFHAATLAFALENGAPPKVSDFDHIIKELRVIPELIERDPDIRMFWLPSWLERTGSSLQEGFREALAEMRADRALLTKLPVDAGLEGYRVAVSALGGTDIKSRGSGTKTALLAAFLAAVSDLDCPASAMKTAANTLGSDTDSIATMAGALVGACTDVDCDHPIQDREYIEEGAKRLALVAQGEAKGSFGYPDLRSWKPARAAVDAVARTDSGLFLDGIGPLERINEPPIAEDDGFYLQWARLGFGQTILAKIRDETVSH